MRLQQANLNEIEKTYRSFTAAGRGILKLFVGNPNEHGFHFPPEVIEQAYADFFRQKSYTPHPKGQRRAREAIAAYYGRQSLELDPENIIITASTSECFFSLFALLTTPGENLLAPIPSYPLFDHIASLARIELRHYRLDPQRRFAIDLEDLAHKIDDKTRAIILISPHNPTGAVVDCEQLREVALLANRRKLPIICDEVFSEFFFGDGAYPRPAAVAPPDLCFTLNGISKMFALPALKLAWVGITGEKKLVEQAVDGLETIADTFLSCHAPIQEALPQLFSTGASFVPSYRQEVKRRRDIALEILNRSPHLQIVKPQGGFYLLAEVSAPPSWTEDSFVIDLMTQTGIFVHPGYFYDYDSQAGISFVMSFLADPSLLQSSIISMLSFLEIDLEKKRVNAKSEDPTKEIR